MHNFGLPSPPGKEERASNSRYRIRRRLQQQTCSTDSIKYYVPVAGKGKNQSELTFADVVYAIGRFAPLWIISI
jgi:hypothetical protein